MVAHVLRFWPEYTSLYNFLHDDSYGSIQRVRLTRRCGLPEWSDWLPNSSRSGGAIRDLLIHDIDQALASFGMPNSVVALDRGPVDTVAATLSYNRGVIVQIEGGWLPAGAPFAMGFEAEREHGRMRLESGHLVIEKAGFSSTMTVPAVNAYSEEIRYFADCCQLGQPPERCLPEDSRRAVQLAVLLEESRRDGGKLLSCTT
jgi:predicted dehydrogenase